MRKIVSLFATLFIFFSATFAQTRNVNGKVTEDNGDAVPFASINVKGTKTSAIAAVDGSFTIKARTGDVLTVSGVGFVTREVTVSDGNSVAITLARGTNKLTDVVVTTALGIQRQAKELGYATAKISNNDLTDAKVTNVGTGLEGKVSGLQVNLINNGVKPDIRVLLRGDRSILGNNQALLVVDDIQLPISYLATINPDDVDNVTVLKGASASALYGSSASNGVIIVTTKKGTRGRPLVKFSTTESVEAVSYLPAFQNQFGQYGGEQSNAPELTYFPSSPYIFYAPYENQNYGPRFNGQTVPLGPPIRVYNADGTYSVQTKTIPYAAQPDAKSGFFNKGMTSQNEVSYSTGDDKSKFYFSFQDVNVTGITPGDVSRRDVIRLNGSRTSGIFTAEYNLAYTLTHNNTTPGSGVPFLWGNTGYVGGYAGGGSYFQNRALYWEIINQPADVNLRNYRNWQTDPFASPNGYFNAYYGNPWWQIDETRLDEKSSDLLGSVVLNLKPTSWLNISYNASIARDDYQNKYTQNGFTFAQWAINDSTNQGSGAIPGAVKAYSPSEGDGRSTNQILTSNFLVSLHKTYHDFDIKLIGGTQFIDNYTNILSTSAGALVIPDFYNISNRLGNPSVGQTTIDTRLVGVFGDLTLGYKEFLFLHGSLRNDWNSLLAPSNNSYLYPAVDAAFIFTDAIPSLKNSSWLSYGKIRAAYSQTAQVSIGAYALQNIFDVGSNFPYGSQPGYTVDNAFANPNIKPELSTDQEIGLELGFMKGRLTFSAAVYNTDTKNQTIPISISSSTGYSTAYVNSGVMNNKGIELDLHYTIIQSPSSFKWDVGGNFAYNKNTVKSLGYGLTDVALPNAFSNADAVFESIDAIVGKPYSQIEVNDWVRDPQGKIVVNAETGLPTAAGNPVALGTSVPPTKIGFTTAVSYKGFTLSAVVDGRFGGVIFNGIGPSLDFTGVSAYSASSGRQPFVIPNSVISENGKYVPNTSVNTGNPNQGAQAFWASVWNSVGSNYVNSADFWKIRELALNYTFPKRIIERLRVVNALNIGLVGRNLFMFRASHNVWTDPEFSNTNGNAVGNTDINQLPPTRFYGATLSVTF